MMPKNSNERLQPDGATSTILPQSTPVQSLDLSSGPLPEAGAGSLFSAFRTGWTPFAPFLETVGGSRWTYAQMCDITAGLSCRLQASGLRRGNRLASQVERSPWNVFLYLACLRAGIVYVPLNPGFTPAEAGPILADLEASVLVCGGSAADGARSLVAGTQTRVLTLEVDGSGSLADVPGGSFLPDAAVDADDAAAIIFTSGTTGRPKGAIMPHRHLALKAHALVRALGWQPSDKLLHAMPLHHAHGLFMTMHCVLCAGASMLLAERFEAAETVGQLRRATVFSGVPTMYHRMADVPALGEASRGIRLFVSASAPLPAGVQQRFEQASDHRLVECWGMTETMTNTATTGDRRPGTVGKPLPGVQVRVLDEDGVPVPQGREGLLAIRSGSRFGGYWRRPPAYQARFEDGFFVTGDVGSIDPEGNVAIAGRTGDVIISGGYNVYPKEVEVALEQLDGVAQAAVFALPHPDFGEAVAAAIVPQHGPPASTGDIAAALKLRLASYKIPKALFVLDALPVTELGKVQRRALAQRFERHFEPAAPATHT